MRKTATSRVIFLTVFGALLGASPLFSHEVLFLGKTGAGKSTLVNIFYNHITGRDYNSERAIIIPLLHAGEELAVNVDKYKAYGAKVWAEGESQTDEVRFYIAQGEGGPVTLWDTPGFMDTMGVVKDVENTRKIATALSNVALKTVVIVIEPTDFRRNTPEFRATMNSIMRMLPKSFLRNVVGIVNRSGSFNSQDKDFFKRKFSELFGFEKLGIEPRVYFINGVSFFEADGKQNSWDSDRNVVRDVLRLASGDKLLRGTEIYDLQELISSLDVYFERLAQRHKAGQRSHLREAIAGLLNKWKDTAVSTDFSPYIEYLDRKIEFIASNRLLTHERRESFIKDNHDWKSRYERIAKGLRGDYDARRETLYCGNDAGF